jgi:hypothetical protein
MASIFLKLIFRDPDGTFTLFSWFFGALALLMIAAGLWCVVAPGLCPAYDPTPIEAAVAMAPAVGPGTCASTRRAILGIPPRMGAVRGRGRHI